MKGQLLEVIKRKIPIDRLAGCSLRYDTSGELSAIIVTEVLLVDWDISGSTLRTQCVCLLTCFRPTTYCKFQMSRF